MSKKSLLQNSFGQNLSEQQFFGLKTKWQGLASLEIIDFKETKYALSKCWGTKLSQAGAHGLLLTSLINIIFSMKKCLSSGLSSDASAWQPKRVSANQAEISRFSYSKTELDFM